MCLSFYLTRRMNIMSKKATIRGFSHFYLPLSIFMSVIVAFMLLTGML